MDMLKLNTCTNLTGSLIIAPPAVKGSFWYKTVIMIIQQNNEGSVGLILNKSSRTSIGEVAAQNDIYADIDECMYQGGPIGRTISLIHSNEWRCKNTKILNEHYSISSADDIIPRFANGHIPDQWRMFAGFCGWAPGQLEREIKGIAPYSHETSWCLASADSDLIFGLDGKEQWISALEQSSMEFAKGILS